MRKPFIDNIRWCTVIIVLIYHVFYIYNSVGVLGGIGGFTAIQYQDSFLYFVYPWFMALLFLIAGISSRYALSQPSYKTFMKDKTIKLLVPSTLGLFVFHFITGYMNIKIGGGLSQIPSALLYPISVLSGVGPLWFIQTLYIFSLLLVLIRKLDSKDLLYNFFKKCNILVLILMCIPVYAASQVLNMPVITTYRFGIYFFVYLLGYFVFSHDEVQIILSRYAVPLLIVSLLMGISYTLYFFGSNYSDASVLQHIYTNLYLWFAILAILGCGKAFFDKSSKFSNYMTRSSFGIYIVHYTITLLLCYFLKTYAKLPIVMIYGIAIAGVLVLSPVVFELLRRIPLIRFLLFGIKKNKNFNEPECNKSHRTSLKDRE